MPLTRRPAPAIPEAHPTTPKAPQAAARAADLAETEAVTEADSAQPAAAKPVLPSDHTKASPSRPSKKTDGVPQLPELNLPPPKYLVGRSANKNWPIYTDYKRGGNLHITTIRKITGDLTALRDELRIFLNKKNNEVHINDLTKQVIVKVRIEHSSRFNGLC